MKFDPGTGLSTPGTKATAGRSRLTALNKPAIYELEGKTVRPLGREVDKAFALIGSLDESQRKQAILGFQTRDLVLGPGRDGQTIQPEGIKGSALTEKQREMLLELASEWTGIMHEAAAKARYLLTLFADSPTALDHRRQQLIASVLADFTRLSGDTA